MQVSVESIGKLERRMQVQVPAERVTSEIAARLKTLSRTARLNGFRPGKAPIAVIRRQFGAQVHREVIGELLQSSFAEAVTQQQLAPAGSPRIEPQNIGRGPGSHLRRHLRGVSGDRLQPIEKLEMERTTAEVTDADVDAMIERLRKQQPKYSAVTRAARDRRPGHGRFRGLHRRRGLRRRQRRERRRSCSARGACCRRSSTAWSAPRRANTGTSWCSFPPITVPPNSPASRREFKVQVKTVEEAALPELDEEFCKSYGVTEGGVPKLREDVADNMRRELQQTLRSHNKTRGHGQALRGESARGAECAGRDAGPRHADRGAAPAPAPRTSRRRRRASRWWRRPAPRGARAACSTR